MIWVYSHNWDSVLSGQLQKGDSVAIHRTLFNSSYSQWVCWWWVMSKLFYFSRTLHQNAKLVSDGKRCTEKTGTAKRNNNDFDPPEPRAQTKIENINVSPFTEWPSYPILSHSAIISSSFSFISNKSPSPGFHFSCAHNYIKLKSLFRQARALGPLMIIISQSFCIYKVMLAHHPTKHDNECLRSYSEEVKMAIIKTQSTGVRCF